MISVTMSSRFGSPPAAWFRARADRRGGNARQLDDSLHHHLRIERHQEEVAGACGHQFVFQHLVAEGRGDHEARLVAEPHLLHRVHDPDGVEPRHEHIHQNHLGTGFPDQLRDGQSVFGRDHRVESVGFQESRAFRAIFSATLHD